MKTLKRFGSVLLILVLAISVGLISNRIWLAIEEANHPTPYREEVMRYSLEYGVPEHIAYAVMKTESGFDPSAVSSVGARGLMQMMEETFVEMTGPLYLNEGLSFDDLFTPEVSIRYGMFYLRYLYDMFGNWRSALAAYNGGLGNVRKWLSNPEYTDGEGNLTYIPFDETRSYVFKVEKAMDVYYKLYFSPQKGE